MPNIKGWLFILRNWKLIIHVLFHTKRFGVNNQWMGNFDSLLAQHRGTLWENYQAVKFRAIACGFLTREECRNLGWRSEI